MSNYNYAHDYTQEVLKKTCEIMPEYLPANIKSFTITGNTKKTTYYCSECSKSFGAPMATCPKCGVKLDEPGSEFKAFSLDKTKRIPIACFTQEKGEKLFFEIVLTCYRPTYKTVKWKRRITIPIVGCVEKNGDVKMHNTEKRQDIVTILKRAECRLDYLNILHLSTLRPPVRAEALTQEMWEPVRKQSKLYNLVVNNLIKFLTNPNDSEWSHISLSTKPENTKEYAEKILAQLEKKEPKKKTPSNAMQQEELFNYKRSFRPAFSKDLKTAIDRIAYSIETPILESRTEMIYKISCSCGHSEQISVKIPTDKGDVDAMEAFENLVYQKAHKCPRCGRNQCDQLIEGKRFQFLDRDINHPSSRKKRFNVVWMEKTGLPDDSILVRIYSFEPDGQKEKMKSLNETYRFFFNESEILVFQNEHGNWQRISTAAARKDMCCNFHRNAIWPQTEKQISDVFSTKVGRSGMFACWNFQKNNCQKYCTPGDISFPATFLLFPGISFLQKASFTSAVSQICQSSFSQISQTFNIKGGSPEEVFGVSQSFLDKVARFDKEGLPIGLTNFVFLLNTTDGKEEEIMPSIWAIKKQLYSSRSTTKTNGISAEHGC